MKKQISPFVLAMVMFVFSGCGNAAPPAANVTATESQQQPATVTVTPTSPQPTATPQPPPPTATLKPSPPTATPQPAPSTPFEISTAAFAPDGPIPEKYTCFGDNISPQLEWSGAPAEAKSLLLLVYDPDAGAESGASTSQGFAHWIVYNIPSASIGYPENVPAGDMADGAIQGRNDFGQFVSEGDAFPGGALIKVVGYDGPCPGEEHHYRFAIYALDALLDLPPAATMTEVLAAMEGHVIAQAEMAGVFAPPN